MFGLNASCLLDDHTHDYHSMEDYTSSIPRWCPACGDHAILTAVQRLCRDEQLPPEKTVFVSGIGCSSRFPHYMNTYGFHSLHGRALPIAQGVKIRRPDLHVFVNTGDGDCCSIGAGHWVHAIHNNMNMVVMLHDNYIYGLTKMQTSPTTPKGFSSNTHPRGALMTPLNPLTTTLSITNVSFVAQAVDWLPDLVYDVIRRGFHHRGLSFIRILQRCPKFTPAIFDKMMSEPKNCLLLHHKNGLQISPAISKTYTNQMEHDPADLNQARQIADNTDKVPVGILYQNEKVEAYDDLCRSRRHVTPDLRAEVLEHEFDKYAIGQE
jgi:2-oxoglutarate/2-oxoacid ferredoxin oxidoreductase subunit beta